MLQLKNIIFKSCITPQTICALTPTSSDAIIVKVSAWDTVAHSGPSDSLVKLSELPV